MPTAEPLDANVFTVETDALCIKATECAACGARFHPPRQYCARCTSREMRDRVADPLGAIETFTIVHQRPPGALLEAPYTLADIQLRSGERFPCVSLEIEGMMIGAPVRLRVAALDTDAGPRAGLVFDLAPEGDAHA